MLSMSVCDVLTYSAITDIIFKGRQNGGDIVSMVTTYKRDTET